MYCEPCLLCNNWRASNFKLPSNKMMALSKRMNFHLLIHLSFFALFCCTLIGLPQWYTPLLTSPLLTTSLLSLVLSCKHFGLHVNTFHCNIFLGAFSRNTVVQCVYWLVSVSLTHLWTSSASPLCPQKPCCFILHFYYICLSSSSRLNIVYHSPPKELNTKSLLIRAFSSVWGCLQ